MAVKGPFFLTICLALLLSVCALQCYKYSTRETECINHSGINCGGYSGPVDVPMTVTNCDSDVTMCVLMNKETTGGGSTYQYVTADCFPKAVGFKHENGCYGKEDIWTIDPEEAQQMLRLEALGVYSVNKFEICICDRNLCNGSVKSAFSISVITTSVIMSVLFFT